MSNFEKISKMNLAELEAPEEIRKREEETENEIRDETGEAGGLPEDGDGTLLTAEDGAADIAASSVEEEGEKEKKPKRIMEPTGKYYCLNTEISQKNLNAFLFGHTYRQPIILLATIFAIIWPIVAIVKKQDNLYIPLICALFILLWLPFSTWNRGKSVKKQNPLYREEFHYMFDEWGLHLQLGEDAMDVEWKRLTKLVEMKTILVLYTGKSNAFIIPIEPMGAAREEMTAFIKEKVRKK